MQADHFHVEVVEKLKMKINDEGKINMEITANTATTGAEWHYELNGDRLGPVSHSEILSLISSSKLTRGSYVWQKGMPDWITLDSTVFSSQFFDSPPPLTGEAIDNTLIWVLAFAPIIGLFLEYVVAGAQYGGNEYLVALAVKSNKYWFITLALNIGLAFFDEKRLKKAGHNTDKFKGWVWLVPVYLYQRAKATKQNLAYFIVWMVCLVLTLLN